VGVVGNDADRHAQLRQGCHRHQDRARRLRDPARYPLEPFLRKRRSWLRPFEDGKPARRHGVGRLDQSGGGDGFLPGSPHAGSRASPQEGSRKLLYGSIRGHQSAIQGVCRCRWLRGLPVLEGTLRRERYGDFLRSGARPHAGQYATSRTGELGGGGLSRRAGRLPGHRHQLVRGSSLCRVRWQESTDDLSLEPCRFPLGHLRHRAGQQPRQCRPDGRGKHPGRESVRRLRSGRKCPRMVLQREQPRPIHPGWGVDRSRLCIRRCLRAVPVGSL